MQISREREGYCLISKVHQSLLENLPFRRAISVFKIIFQEADTKGNNY